jgi:hypothetical protein
MVIKGTSCAGAGRIAAHLSCTETNERNELHELRGVAAEDLRGALREMEAVAKGARSKRPFYHASINTPVHERLTDEQRAHAIDRLEAALGLAGQPRVVVIHRKAGRDHTHIVWSRVEIEHMRAISDSHNFAKHERVARELEGEFGHARVQGAHVEREGRPRPKRTPSHAEMLQAERTGISPQGVKKQVTDIWLSTTTASEFADKLKQAGFLLARGDRRDFVIVDRKGGVHSLARRVEGVNAADIRARMAGLDPAQLSGVGEVRRRQRERAGGEAVPVRATSSSGRNGASRRRAAAGPKRVRKGLRRSGWRKHVARNRLHHRRTGFGVRPNRRFAGLDGAVLPRTRGPPFPGRCRRGGRFEFRPPRLYAWLEDRPNSGGGVSFGSRPGTRIASSRAPPRSGSANEPFESPRSITAASQPADRSGDLRSSEVGASGPGNSDGENVELGQALSAIAEQVNQQCAAVCQGIEAQFAARQAFARKSLPKNQIAGALATISAERRAALAVARQQAKMELFGRSRAAKSLYRRQPRRPAASRIARSPDRGAAQLG